MRAVRVVDCVIPDGFTCFIWLHLYLHVGTYNGMEYLKGWSDPCVTSMQHFCALCLPKLLVPHFSTDSLCVFFLLVNYAHTQWVLNVLHPIIIRNTCGWKRIWKYVQCLKTENMCLNTCTKRVLYFFFF